MTYTIKKLKRGKDGLFTCYVGQNERGVPKKFRLGYDREATAETVRLIATIWTEATSRFPQDIRPSWHADSVMAAKAIARGAAPSLPRRDHEAPSKYVGRVADISRQTGTPFLPASPEIHQIGLDDLRAGLGDARRELSKAVGETATAITGISVRGQIATYVENIRRGFTLPDGHLRPWGRTKLDQLDSIARYLSDARFGGRDFLALDLCELTFGRCEEMFGVFRRRPRPFGAG